MAEHKYTVRRVGGNMKWGRKNHFPHPHDDDITKEEAIKLAKNLNARRTTETNDFYVVFKNGSPFWSPQSELAEAH